MALDQPALLELVEMLNAVDAGEMMRKAFAGVPQECIDLEATTAHLSTARHERTGTRTTQRNGTRDRTVTTTAGDVTGKIPTTRTGSFFPPFLSPRRQIAVALHWAGIRPMPRA